MDIASLYEDVQIRHALTARLKLEVLRINANVADAAPATVREDDPDHSVGSACTATLPSPVGYVR